MTVERELGRVGLDGGGCRPWRPPAGRSGSAVTSPAKPSRRSILPAIFTVAPVFGSSGTSILRRSPSRSTATGMLAPSSRRTGVNAVASTVFLSADSNSAWTATVVDSALAARRGRARRLRRRSILAASSTAFSSRKVLAGSGWSLASGAIWLVSKRQAHRRVCRRGGSSLTGRASFAAAPGRRRQAGRASRPGNRSALAAVGATAISVASQGCKRSSGWPLMLHQPLVARGALAAPGADRGARWRSSPRLTVTRAPSAPAGMVASSSARRPASRRREVNRSAIAAALDQHGNDQAAADGQRNPLGDGGELEVAPRPVGRLADRRPADRRRAARRGPGHRRRRR